MKEPLVKKLAFEENLLFKKNIFKREEILKNDNFPSQEDFNYKYSNEHLYYKSEIALWKSVILQAFIDLQSYSKKKIANTYRIKALMWFNLKNQEFLTVCNYADLDPHYVYETSRNIKEHSKFFL